MIRIGYFDADGKCLIIQSGPGEPPPIDFAYTAEVPHGLGPNHVEFRKGKARKKAAEKVVHEKKVDPLAARVAELEAKLAELLK